MKSTPNNVISCPASDFFHVNSLVQLNMKARPFSEISKCTGWPIGQERDGDTDPQATLHWTGLHEHLEKLFEGCRLSMSWYEGLRCPASSPSNTRCRDVRFSTSSLRGSDKPTASPTSQVTVLSVDHLWRTKINIWNRRSYKSQHQITLDSSSFTTTVLHLHSHSNVQPSKTAS